MGSPLRILHVVVNMNRGGAETLIMNLYRNIDRSKVQFDFLTCKEGVFDKEIIALGGRIHRIPYITDVGHFGYLKELNSFFESYSGYRIVHSHMDKMSGLVLRAAKKVGLPVRIAHSHNTSSEGGIVARTYKSYAGSYILSCATDLLACSELAAKWLFTRNAKNCSILRNGIDCEKFAFSHSIRNQMREELNLDENCFVIGHVGRFNHQKNHSFLLEIFQELTRFKTDTILLLVGHGPLREDMENKAKNLGIDHRVRFLGIRSDVNQLFQAFDAFVFPSFHEGLPVTLVEAQGSGLPCVISEKITKEVDLGLGLVEYSSLDERRMWIEKINSIAERNLQRTIPSSVLSNAGYDIRNAAKWTEDYYLSIAR